MTDHPPKTIVISGATDGMGRALALARLMRGDRLIAVGSSPDKLTALVAEASAAGVADRLHPVRADLSVVGENRRVIAEISERADALDALLLFANRLSPRRVETADGLEHTFALYYLSRYLLARGLSPLLDNAPAPVVVTVAGVGTTAGGISWDDLQLNRRYAMVRATTQAARANDLLGVAFAEQRVGKARFVMYHPGFTRSGDLTPLPPPARFVIRILAAIRAQPIDRAIAPMHDFIDSPPPRPLTAIDRGNPVDPSLPTLDPTSALRLAAATERLLAEIDQKR
jgi:NAD(P)-dependent dehydrogenase (short-subunit alcohol dehydrogenase family)